MQGTAAAYDLARFGDASSIVLADYDLAIATESASRVNKLTGTDLVEPRHINAKDITSVAEMVKSFDVVLSCVPYKLHESVENACFAAGVSVIDMGNDTDVTMEILNRDAEIQAKGITFVPDTGLAPGLVNSIASHFISELDETDEIKLYCGGLPQQPQPPLNYSLRFSVEGLVGEYVDVAIAIRDHQVVRLETLEELESVDVPGIGAFEAFTTSSGTSTAPYTFCASVRSYEYKTLRYPGHCDYMRLFRHYGFWEEEPISVRGTQVKPLDFFCALMGEKLSDPADKDLVIVYAVAAGTKDGQRTVLEAVILDNLDEVTGFTAMERMTGFSTAIMAIEVAHGRVRKGAVRYEQAVTGKTVMDALQKRGITINLTKTLV